MTSKDDRYPDALGVVPYTPPALPGFADPRRRLVERLIAKLAVGTLRVVLPTGAVVVKSGPIAGPEATIHLHRWRALARVVLRGDIGFGEAFVAGDWSSPDLVELLRLAARNLDALETTIRGSTLARTLARLRHVARPNSKRGSKRNIVAHYDLGNDFYRLWLDPGMSYSSALYRATDGGDLETAQRAKYRRILRRLRAQPGQSVLEIGCGWGGFAEFAAREIGCKVTGLTISRAQHDYAAERIAKAQASRGAGIGGGGSLWRRARQALPLVIPLFLTSLRRAENMALAMEARGYSSGQAHTSMTEFNMHPRDAGVLILVLLVESAMFWL